MAITVEFDGRYRNKISNVSPNDIILKGKSLFVKGILIPAMPDRLYDLFSLLEKQTRYKYGKLSIALFANGDVEYQSTTSNSAAEYYADKILSAGVQRYYRGLARCNVIPSDDVYRIGKQEEEYCW